MSEQYEFESEWSETEETETDAVCARCLATFRKRKQREHRNEVMGAEKRFGQKE